jgi:hypothetical protein
MKLRVLAEVDTPGSHRRLWTPAAVQAHRPVVLMGVFEG